MQVQPDLMHLAFEVDDLAAFADQCAKKGCALSDGPTRTGSGSLIAFIDAPEGYEVELIQRGSLPRRSRQRSRSNLAQSIPAGPAGWWRAATIPRYTVSQNR